MKTLILTALLLVGASASASCLDQDQLGQACSIDENTTGVCQWPEGFVLPACLPVIHCVPDTLGHACVKSAETGETGTCVWAQGFFLPECE